MSNIKVTKKVVIKLKDNLLYCPVCEKETKHLFFDYLPKHLQYKCRECGEYNKEQKKYNQDSEKKE